MQGPLEQRRSQQYRNDLRALLTDPTKRGVCVLLPPDETSAFEAITELIDSAETIAISGHTDPDGDSLGSVLALMALIEERRPQAIVQPLLANDRPADATYAFLPGIDRMIPAVDYTQDPDLFIAVDTPSVARLADAGAVLLRARSAASFDHHSALDEFAQASYVSIASASVGDLIYDYVVFLGQPFTKAVAVSLLTAIVTDTGRFQYQNTNAHALRASADLIEAGASISQICSAVYQSYSLAALKLKEIMLDRLATVAEGAIAYSWVTQADLATCGAAAADCDSLIDEVRTLGGTDACLFMREQADHKMRGNLRAKADWLDVSQVAAYFGGGGHRAAAGFTIADPPDVAVSEALTRLIAAVDAAEARQR